MIDDVPRTAIFGFADDESIGGIVQTIVGFVPVSHLIFTCFGEDTALASECEAEDLRIAGSRVAAAEYALQGERPCDGPIIAAIAGGIAPYTCGLTLLLRIIASGSVC